MVRKPRVLVAVLLIVVGVGALAVADHTLQSPALQSVSTLEIEGDVYFSNMSGFDANDTVVVSYDEEADQLILANPADFGEAVIDVTSTLDESGRQKIRGLVEASDFAGLDIGDSVTCEFNFQKVVCLNKSEGTKIRVRPTSLDMTRGPVEGPIIVL